MEKVSPKSDQVQGWGEWLWEGTKTQASNAAEFVYNLCPSLFDRIQAIFDFIYPKNAITGYREFWYLPTWVEKTLGEALYASNCASQGGKLNDEGKQTRLKAMVEKTAEHAQREGEDQKFDYEVTVLDSNVLNAWAMPGGKLAFNDRLIKEVDKMDLSEWKGLTHDDVLAAVVGHEVSHAAIGHTRKRLEKTFLIQLALFVGKIVANIFIGRKEQEAVEKGEKKGTHRAHIETADELRKYEGYRKLVTIGFDYFAYYASQLYMLMDSRNAEYEADKYGIELMYKAGYDVRGSLALQKLFEKQGHSHQTDSWLGKVMEWISTHPTSDKRYTENEKTVQGIIEKHGKTKAASAA